AGTPIDLGGSDTASPLKLGLTAAELSSVTAGTSQIGSATARAITVTAAIAPAHATTPDLASGAGLTEPAAAATITPTPPASRTVGAVTLNQPNDVQTTSLAANVTGANQGFTFTDANALTIGTVDSVIGITTNGGNISLTFNGQVNLSAP